MLLLHDFMFFFSLKTPTGSMSYGDSKWLTSGYYLPDGGTTGWAV
jgi:hypothetical protein